MNRKNYLNNADRLYTEIWIKILNMAKLSLVTQQIIHVYI